MRISLRQTYTFLFLIGVFFIPFNSYEGISFLGEYRKDGAIIFFLISFILFFIDAFLKRTNIVPIYQSFKEKVQVWRPLKDSNPRPAD